jgi:hypothetical protein
MFGYLQRGTLLMAERRLSTNLHLLAVGLALIAGALLLDHWFLEAPPEIVTIDGKPVLKSPAKSFEAKLALLFLAELGVALVIAWVISVWIERQARERDNAEAEERRRLIAENVVLGVWGLQHKPAYVRTVLETNLQPTTVRDAVDMDFSVRRLTPQEVKRLGVEPDRFVVLRMMTSFRFLNLSSKTSALDVRYSVAIRGGKRLREFTRVESASLAGVQLTPSEITAAETIDPQRGMKRYCWPRTIPGGGTLPVTISCLTIKEASDSEVWGSYFPTVDGASFSLQVLPEMRFGVRPLLASPCNNVSFSQAEGVGVWKVEGSILPNDSIVFWWRLPEDDGDDEAEKNSAERVYLSETLPRAIAEAEGIQGGENDDAHESKGGWRQRLLTRALGVIRRHRE